MILELFQKVPAGAIQTLFDDQNQTLFKRSDLGKYLGIRNIRDNFNKVSLHHARARSEIEGVDVTNPVRRTKYSHDIFINLESAIEIAVRSKKPKAVALVKCLIKKGIEKIHEEHQQATTGCDNQTKALESTNEKHQQKILKLNKEIDDLIVNKHVARCEYFDNVLCFIKNNSGEVHPYYVNRCQYKQLEKHK